MKLVDDFEAKGHHKFNKNFGKLPEYVIKFRQKKENEKIREFLKQKEEDIPPGCRLVGEKERIETL